MTIALVLPSRGRPALFERMMRSAWDNATKPEEVVFFLGLNIDDPAFAEYAKDILLTEPWANVSGYAADVKGRHIWNDLSKRAVASGASWVWIGSDDIIFETKGWDTLLNEHITNRPHFVWGDDGSCGDRHASHPFLNRAWLEVVGKAMPDCCQQYDGDTFVTELGKFTGACAYDGRIITRHMHAKYGLGVEDATWRATKPLQKVDFDVYRGPVGRAEYAEALAQLQRSLGGTDVAGNEGMARAANLAWRNH